MTTVTTTTSWDDAMANGAAASFDRRGRIGVFSTTIKLGVVNSAPLTAVNFSSINLVFRKVAGQWLVYPLELPSYPGDIKWITEPLILEVT